MQGAAISQAGRQRAVLRDTKNTAPLSWRVVDGGLAASTASPSMVPSPLVVATGHGALADRSVRGLGFAAALALHAAVLGWLLMSPAPEPLAGAGGQQLDAIEITVVESGAIETREPAAVAPDAALAYVAPQQGDQAPADTSQAAEQEKETTEQKVELLAEPEPAPPETPREQPQRQAAIDQSQGGQAASGIAGTHTAPARAAASPGTIGRYAAQVSAILARNKPRGHGRGEVTVTFTISSQGRVSVARVSKSSGSRTLDEEALAAVRRSAFPAPPELMTERDLTYDVPYKFRQSGG